jgi:hypothetical protein
MEDVNIIDIKVGQYAHNEKCLYFVVRTEIESQNVYSHLDSVKVSVKYGLNKTIISLVFSDGNTIGVETDKTDNNNMGVRWLKEGSVNLISVAVYHTDIKLLNHNPLKPLPLTLL